MASKSLCPAAPVARLAKTADKEAAHVRQLPSQHSNFTTQQGQLLMWATDSENQVIQHYFFLLLFVLAILEESLTSSASPYLLKFIVPNMTHMF
jgi:hypothetical protein